MKSYVMKKQLQAFFFLSVLMMSFQNCSPGGFHVNSGSDGNSSSGAESSTTTTTTIPGATTTSTTMASTTTTTQASSSSLIEGKNTTPPNLSMPRPALNVPFIDPVYGTTITRVTEASQVTDVSIPAWVRHEYSRRPSMNADSSRALMVSSNGWLRLYSVDKAGNKLNFLKTLSIGGTIEPNWHPTNPNILYYFNGQKIMSYDIQTDVKTTARDLTGRMPFGPSDATMWTKEEGRPSDDGKIWCFMIEKYNSSNQSVSHYGLVAYNFESDQIIGSLAVTERPDHISTSPKGNYCVPSWDTSRGTRAYKTDFSSYTQLHSKSEHSDLTTSKDGKEMYVYTDYTTGFVSMVDMATGTKTNLFELYGSNSSATAIHISGTAKSKPGYVLIGFYACSQNYGSQACDPTTQWFKDKVVAVELKANPKIYNLAHTHYGNGGYWTETQAVVNSDFTRILFVSTWGSTAENDLSSYMISLPPNALP